MQLQDLACLFSNSYGPAEVLSFDPRFSDARAYPLAQDFVFERGEHRQKPSHGATRRRCQIQGFGEGYKGDAQFGKFFQGDD